jgi:RNA polymerase sigma factor (sigma-70 family)
MLDSSKVKKSENCGSILDARSIEELFRLQRPSLIRFAMSRINDKSEAEDIVQDAFIRFQNRYTAQEVLAPEALLVRITTNLVIDKFREKSTRSAREDAWAKFYTAGADMALSTAESVDPARILSAKQQVEKAIGVLNNMPEKTRKIFLLHRFEGLTHSEVSLRTNIPKSTIEKHMIRAIRALSKIKRG